MIKKDLLGLKDIDKDEILNILEIAKEMKIKIDNPHLRDDCLKTSGIITMFYENSTRTKTSFMLAGKYLGSDVTDIGISTSSVNKGESLIDTGKTLDQMGADVFVLRHSFSGAAHLLAKNVSASVINAGDGTNEHPSQALLDLFTIFENKNCFKGLKVGIIGDINHSRVARSNVFGLTKLGAEVVLAGPSTLISSGLTQLGIKVTTKVIEAIEGADVVMGLRIQTERQKRGAFPNIREYSGLYGIDGNMLKAAKSDVIVMHPGPVNRGVELTSDVINGKNSVIDIQVKNGVAVRMAVLKTLMQSRR